MTLMITTSMVLSSERDMWAGETLSRDGRRFRWVYIEGELLDVETVDGDGIRWPMRTAPAELVAAVRREARRRAH
ncbi:hypothetical protein [Bradyrhizobium sp. DOA1]|uniref:hypothetical protein n=1 Tax=Bradyrhizobium sp. DOA1 TaxID=1126616 RepID=UPI00077CA145|nr:hypothetical protein [Bradyrhizobium sp. DOA1]KYH01701.1 hypothetical protein SE91_27330 [Bradyrhizobium sp. DOA1]